MFIQKKAVKKLLTGLGNEINKAGVENKDGTDHSLSPLTIVLPFEHTALTCHAYKVAEVKLNKCFELVLDVTVVYMEFENEVFAFL